MRRFSEAEVSLPWLVRLRWLALVGQLTAVAMARLGFELDIALEVALALLAAGAISNVALAAWARRVAEDARVTAVVGGVLVLDTLLITGMLAVSGGATNPFSIFYLVQISLAAVVLGARWTTLVAALSIACFALLFTVPAPHSEHHGHFASHLHGMWVAFTLAAVLVAFFVRRIATTIALQREQIAELREHAARSARLASLTTLAAGAAHELGTPLGTIAVAAHEVHRSTSSSPEAAEIREDMELIVGEVERCQEILGKLSARCEASLTEEQVTLGELEPLLRTRLGAAAARVRVEVARAAADRRVPKEHTLQSLVALVRNAIDASTSGDVAVSIAERDREVVISVEDRGEGMDSAVLAQAGDPFFTTKSPGRGLGLGLFLVRAFAESLGGRLELDSRPGEGTRARVVLPAIALESRAERGP
ncbi:ATP-binding protein [Myxococcota bacterium]|nr:ATP-binding protein [Myxococcota bacterium]